jgi:hypothetical protein
VQVARQKIHTRKIKGKKWVKRRSEERNDGNLTLQRRGGDEHRGAKSLRVQKFKGSRVQRLRS